MDANRLEQIAAETAASLHPGYNEIIILRALRSAVEETRREDVLELVDNGFHEAAELLKSLDVQPREPKEEA